MSAKTFFVAVLLLAAGLDVLGLGFVGALVAFGALVLGGSFVYRRVRQLAAKATARYTPSRGRNCPIPNQKYFQNRSFRLPSSFWMNERNA
jgi:hypothetical protein